MARVALGLLLFLFAGCAAPEGETTDRDGGNASDDDTEDLTGLLDQGLESAFTKFDDAMTAVETSDWTEARIDFNSARDQMRLVQGPFNEIANRLPDDGERAYRVTFDLGGTMLDAFLSLVNYGEAFDEFELTLAGAETDEEVVEAIYLGEQVETTAERTATDFEAVATKAEFLTNTDAALAVELGLDTAIASDYREVASILRKDAGALDEELDILRADYADLYFSPADRELLPLSVVEGVPEDLVSDDLVALFDEFDFDGDGAIDVNEAQEFYYWVEDEVTYRYDDEDERNPLPGSPVGDGRPGPDYHQTPSETFEEKFGDCEDMNRLEVAFFNYWGIPAYQAYVNALASREFDHAIAIVLIAETPDDFADLLGQLDYYELAADDGWGVPAGVYAIVDNAYSDAFGYISSGIEPDQFDIYEIHTLEETDFENEID